MRNSPAQHLQTQSPKWRVKKSASAAVYTNTQPFPYSRPNHLELSPPSHRVIFSSEIDYSPSLSSKGDIEEQKDSPFERKTKKTFRKFYQDYAIAEQQRGIRLEVESLRQQVRSCKEELAKCQQEQQSTKLKIQVSCFAIVAIWWCWTQFRS